MVFAWLTVGRMLVDPSSLAPRYRSALFKLGVDVVRVSLREIRALRMISVGAVESVCNATVLGGWEAAHPRRPSFLWQNCGRTVEAVVVARAGVGSEGLTVVGTAGERVVASPCAHQNYRVGEDARGTGSFRNSIQAQGMLFLHTRMMSTMCSQCPVRKG